MSDDTADRADITEAENPPVQQVDPSNPEAPDSEFAATADAAAVEPIGTTVGHDVDSINLDEIERDLDDVQAALQRLNDGTYWVDEITGDPIPDDVLAERPTARSASSTGSPQAATI